LAHASGVEQLAPLHPGWQKHSPRAHSPRPEQSPTHGLIEEQSSPT